jgi:oligosaccharide repeat unit polymerase
MRTQGFNFEDLIFQSVATAASYRASRNEQMLDVNVFSKMEVGFAYIAVTVGGLLFATARTRSRAALALAGSFAPALAQLMLQGAKGLMFQFISLFFAGVLVVRLFRGQTFLINAAGVRRGVLIAAVIAPLTIMSILSRGLSASDRAVVTRIVKGIAASYAFGHLYAFSDWVSFRMGEPSALRYPVEPTGYGYYTFTPYFKALGSTRQTPPGTYDDYYTDGELLTTNIFTMFRGSIIDFGVPGALVYTFITGFVAHLAFYFLLAKRRPVVSTAFYIFLLGYIYSSMMVSFVAYNVTTLSFLASVALLFTNNVVASVRRDGRDAIRGHPAALPG